MKGGAYLLAECGASNTLTAIPGRMLVRLKYEAQIIAVDKSLMTPRCYTRRDKQRADVVPLFAVATRRREERSTYVFEREIHLAEFVDMISSHTRDKFVRQNALQHPGGSPIRCGLARGGLTFFVRFQYTFGKAT